MTCPGHNQPTSTAECGRRVDQDVLAWSTRLVAPNGVTAGVLGPGGGPSHRRAATPAASGVP